MSDPQRPTRADLGYFRELLARFEQLWVDRDTVTLRYLRPGLTDAQIDSATEPLGLRLPVEARAWFGWHDGVASDPGDALSMKASRVGPPMELCTLQDCVRETQTHREIARVFAEVGVDPQYVWPPSWFVLAGAFNGDPMIIDCAVPHGEVTPVRTRDWAEIEDQRQIKVPSFTTVVATWVGLIEDGVYTYDPGISDWRADFDRLTPEQRMADVY